MKYEIMINPLVADIRIGEVVIKRFSPYVVKKQRMDEIKYSYLEQAKFCIDAYFSMIRSGSDDLYAAARLLSQAAYSVRQAKNVYEYNQRKGELK